MSAAIVKVSRNDANANFLADKLFCDDGTVNIAEVTESGERKIRVRAPGGGTPEGIIMNVKLTSDPYELEVALYNIVIITNPEHIITLPAASTWTPGMVYIFKDGTGQAGEDDQNNLTITPDPADTIEGLAAGESLVLVENYQTVMLFSDLNNTIHIITSLS